MVISNYVGGYVDMFPPVEEHASAEIREGQRVDRRMWRSARFVLVGLVLFGGKWYLNRDSSPEPERQVNYEYQEGGALRTRVLVD